MPVLFLFLLLSKLYCLLWIFQSLLGIPTEEVEGTLTSIVTYTRGEQVKRNYTQQQAQGKMFSWIFVGFKKKCRDGQVVAMESATNINKKIKFTVIQV